MPLIVAISLRLTAVNVDCKSGPAGFEAHHREESEKGEKTLEDCHTIQERRERYKQTLVWANYLRDHGFLPNRSAGAEGSGLPE